MMRGNDAVRASASLEAGAIPKTRRRDMPEITSAEAIKKSRRSAD